MQVQARSAISIARSPARSYHNQGFHSATPSRRIRARCNTFREPTLSVSRIPRDAEPPISTPRANRARAPGRSARRAVADLDSRPEQLVLRLVGNLLTEGASRPSSPGLSASDRAPASREVRLQRVRLDRRRRRAPSTQLRSGSSWGRRARCQRQGRSCRRPEMTGISSDLDAGPRAPAERSRAIDGTVLD